MATLPFSKIRLSVMRDAAPEVLDAAQKIGVVEFQDITYEQLVSEDRHDFDSNYEASQLDFAVSFLEKFEKRNIITKVMEGTFVYTTEDDIKETVQSFPYHDIVAEAHTLEASLNEAEASLEELAKEESLLVHWVGLPFDLSEQLITHTTTTLFLTIPENEVASIRQECDDISKSHELQYIGDDSYTLTYLTQDTHAIQDMLNRYQAETIQLPKRDGTPRDALRAITEERRELQQKQTKLTDRATDLTKHLSKLKQVADFFHWQRARQDTLYSHGKTSASVYVFEGWCPDKYRDQLYHEIDRITHDFHLETIEPHEDDVPPTELENKKSIWPFESVTRLYGVPTSRDLDPTPFMSGFFFLFFGLCLTDVGYGLFLAIITGLLLLLYRVQRPLKQLLVLLLLGGLSSFIVGIFFGGYFGADIALMPQFLQNLQYFDPIGSPLPFFYLTLALGFTQIVVGLFLDIARQTKFTTFRDGVMDNGPWLLLFLGISLYVSGMFEAIPAHPLYTWVIVLALILIVLSKGRKEKNIIAKGFKGVLGLYGFIDYFADVLSYSRLLALGLATSALAFSINLIAALLNDMMPAIIAPIAVVVVLVVGHTFNLVVNVLGAYIHTARLQFVEFFGKFLNGTGKPFQPFRRNERNVVLE